MDHKPELWLIRHGETEWSLSGAHTSRTNIPLTDRGRERARELQPFLAPVHFTAVLTSPMQRARETCQLSGLADRALVEPNLREWDYGIYEGKTTKEIRQSEPGWSVWNDPIREGETAEAVGERADAVIQHCFELTREASAEPGSDPPCVALFAHAHILRILAARWIELPARAGQLFALGTGSVSRLGWERETRVVAAWNRTFGDE